MTEQPFAFGGRAAFHSTNCCGKPVGCVMTQKECLYLRHPWKRAMVFGDQTVRCQATAWAETGKWQCVLLNGHEGPCEPPAGPDDGA